MTTENPSPTTTPDRATSPGPGRTRAGDVRRPRTHPSAARVAGRPADGGWSCCSWPWRFLLGVFPLKDADIYWHLRTGQIIRETGQVPRIDFFTFTREGAPWIDLHWLFQIGVSWLYEHGGVVALNLAKCAVTCVAVLILVTVARREWPLWVMLVAWLPALLVLGGRMYVRPETLSLLYLSIFLASLRRWDRHPCLVAILPFVQVAWVNSHGLFVLGPDHPGLRLIDASLRCPSPGFAGDIRRGAGRWWRIVGTGSLATFAACLINPYGLRGAVFPIELAGTMTNTVFSHNIAELTPIPVFIRRAGLGNLPLQLHFLTMGLGVLELPPPVLWSVAVRFAGDRTVEASLPTGSSLGQPLAIRGRIREKDEGRDGPDRNPRKKKIEPESPATVGGRVRSPTRIGGSVPFRSLLFAAFSYLSLQATRNSHQFAAVVGTVTAWNFGEWAAASGGGGPSGRARTRLPTSARADPGAAAGRPPGRSRSCWRGSARASSTG